jgi:hypothetical protein
MRSTREFGSSVAPVACGSRSPAVATATRSVDLAAIPIAAHEQAMRLAIAQGRGNPAFRSVR